MKLLNKYRIGLVLRAFASEMKQTGETVSGVLGAIERAKALHVDGQPVFSRVDVMVPMDSRYVDCDAGYVASTLESLQGRSDKVRKAFCITEVTEGDPFCSALNFGLANQVRAGMDYSMILSWGVASYLTEENVHAMLDALEAGARVTGVALRQFEDSILDGRILATLKIWHLQSLMRVGMYDMRAAQPTVLEAKEGNWRWTRENDKWVYTVAGVEEMFPLIHMIRLFGPCIAPIKPREKHDESDWTTVNNPAVRAREEHKIRTKLNRQVRAATMEDVDLDFIKSGIMPGYPR